MIFDSENPALGEGQIRSLLAETWSKLEAFLAQIYRLEEPVESWFTPDVYMSLYTLAFEFCATRREESPVDRFKAANIQGKELYDGLVSFYSRALPALREQILSARDTTLAYLQLWDRYSAVAAHVEAVFQYLDRFWVTREIEEKRAVLHIYPLLWRAWDEHLLAGAVEQRLFVFVEGCLAAERADYQRDHDMHVEANPLVVRVIQSYRTLDCRRRALLTRPVDAISCVPASSMLAKTSKAAGVSSRPFADRLLCWYWGQLERHCKSMLAAITQQNGGMSVDLARLIFKFWQDEGRRTHAYLAGASFPTADSARRINQTMKNHLLVPVMQHFVDVLQAAVAGEENPVPTIQAIYDVLSPRRSLLLQLVPSVEAAFLLRFQARLPRVASSAKGEQVLMLISMLNAMFQEGRRIVLLGMKGDPNMYAALDAALRTFVSDSRAKESFAPTLPEYLVKWADRQLREGDLAPSHPALLFVMTMVRFMEDRDLFQRCYARLLARRLLGQQAVFDGEREQVFLDLLASTYGKGFVAGTRKMLGDVELSLQLTQKFTNRTKRARLGFDLSFQILSSGAWPVSREHDAFPWDAHLEECLESFGAFYSEQFSSRLLAWSPVLTSAEVLATFAGRSFTIIMSAPQLSILGALEEPPGQLGIAELATRTSLAPALLQSSLQKMLHIGLVASTPSGSYRINEAFACAHSRINISQQTESERVDATETPRDFVEDRSLYLQAKIVQHMKKAGTAAISALEHALEVDGAELARALDLLAEKEYVRLDSGHLTYLP